MARCGRSLEKNCFGAKSLENSVQALGCGDSGSAYPQVEQAPWGSSQDCLGLIYPSSPAGVGTMDGSDAALKLLVAQLLE